jgi:hypothetical protein
VTGISLKMRREARDVGQWPLIDWSQKMPKSREGVLTAPLHNPLVAILIEEKGVTETHYLVGVNGADTLATDDEAASPIRLAGAWSDLDADAMLDALDQARHGSKPTPRQMPAAAAASAARAAG